MRMKKKGDAGEATLFISRSRAVRKLQISLADFRRLCILKGVYPREPKNKKRVGKNTAINTYYYVKDINFLAHEPLLDKFRQMKTYLKRMRKAVDKKESAVVAKLQQARPKLKVDHLVRERYPTFIDAVRDLDDALCLLFLFAQMPQIQRIQTDLIGKCRRLCDEFMQYVIISRSLRKVFLSIKGIYYQADIFGQTVTWITPYQFSTRIPSDVDFKVMETFLQFYVCLLGCVNVRLYASLNLQYPPKLVAEKDDDGAGLSALVMETVDAAKAAAATATASTATAADGKAAGGKAASVSKEAGRKQIDSLKKALPAITKAARSAAADEMEVTPAAVNEEDKLDVFPAQIAGGQEVLDNFETLLQEQQNRVQHSRLFQGLNFFLNRETPRYSLEFAIRSFGGTVSWQTAGSKHHGGLYAEDDERITHHIVDRPVVSKQALNRKYVQPQWVYDCINAQKLLPVAAYGVGQVLPPHLSPFVEEGPDDYAPPEKRALLAGTQGLKEGAATDEAAEVEEDDEDAEAAEGEEDENEEDEEEEEEVDEDDEEAVYRRELAAESKGQPYAKVFAEGAKALKAGKGAKQPKAKGQTLDDEHKELAKVMMTKKDRRLYSRIMYGKKKKQIEAEELGRKRKEYEESSKSKKAKTSA